MPDFVTIVDGEYHVKPSEWWVERCGEVPEYNHHAETNQPRTITLDEPLVIARFPVTNAEFEQHMPGHRRSAYGPEDDHPVTAVTYYEVLKYCEANGFRLPTRQEWLVAAVGNTGWTLANSPDMDLSKINRFDPSSNWPGPNLKGDYPPNPFGLYDMSGNVWEFNGPVHTAKAGDAVIQLVMVSGGSWGTCKFGSVPFRYNVQDPLARSDRTGFRVVRDDA